MNVRKRILIAEDEVDLLELYDEMLTSEGYNVQLFFSGAEALSFLKENDEIDIDLIIADKKMGKVTGLDLLAYVEEKHEKVPFFLVTGDNSKEVTFKHKSSRVIRKPFKFQNLFEQLEEVLGSQVT